MFKFVSFRFLSGLPSKFNFDTYKLVRQLERNQLTRGQAVAVMRTINAFLVDGTLARRSAIVSSIDMENDAYLFKAKLQDLRNELQLLRQNDSANLKADTDTIVREIDALHQKFTEIVASLKADVAMDLNNHKGDSRELESIMDLRIQEIHHKLILRLSDVKTQIEAMKVEITRNIIWMVIVMVSSLILIDFVRPEQEPEQSSPAIQTNFPFIPPSIIRKPF